MQIGNRNYVLIPRPPFFRGKKRLLSRESGTTFSLATMMSGKDGKEGAKGNGSFVLLLGPCGRLTLGLTFPGRTVTGGCSEVTAGSRPSGSAPEGHERARNGESDLYVFKCLLQLMTE